MRGEVVEVRDTGGWFWDVVTRLPNGHHTYRFMGKDKYPDQLSAFMAVTKELDQEEQTNGNHC